MLLERYKIGLIVKFFDGKYILRRNVSIVTKISVETVLQVILVFFSFNQMNSIINFQWRHSNEAN